MRRSKTASTKNSNGVQDEAMYKINKTTEKQFIPGTYTLHHAAHCDQIQGGRPIHLKKDKSREGKEFLKIYSRENVRDLLVPVPENLTYPTIFPAREIRRMKTAGNEFSKKQRLAKIQQYEANKKQLEEECERRKLLMKEIDRAKAEDQKVTSNISEGENLRGKILDRAFLAQQEETEEIKRANRLILATKCHVIRDAQIAEKYEIERELREEDNRLDKMMLDEREKAVKLVDLNEMRQKMYNAKHADDIKLQLQQREVAKLLEAERIEDEAKVIAAAIAVTNVEVEEQEKQRKKQKSKLKEELEKFKELSENFKSIAFEENRIAEMKAQEYMRKKQERDRAVLRERRLKLEQQQREADALLKLQTKQLATKNEREEMNLRRNQEEKEREFRRKEKEAAIKRKQLEKDLEIIRSLQLREVQEAKAMEMTRDKMEFDIALEKLKAEEAREKRKQERFFKEQEKYKIDIINQMKQKEKQKREQQRLQRIEFEDQQKKEKDRIRNIQTIINAKIDVMRTKIPERFVKDCERQLRPSTTGNYND